MPCQHAKLARLDNTAQIVNTFFLCVCVCGHLSNFNFIKLVFLFVSDDVWCPNLDDGG